MEQFISFILKIYPGCDLDKNYISKQQIANLVSCNLLVRCGTFIDYTNEQYILYGIRDDNVIIYTNWIDFNECLYSENLNQRVYSKQLWNKISDEHDNNDDKVFKEKVSNMLDKLYDKDGKLK